MTYKNFNSVLWSYNMITRDSNMINDWWKFTKVLKFNLWNLWSHDLINKRDQSSITNLRQVLTSNARLDLKIGFEILGCSKIGCFRIELKFGLLFEFSIFIFFFLIILFFFSFFSFFFSFFSSVNSIATIFSTISFW